LEAWLHPEALYFLHLFVNLLGLWGWIVTNVPLTRTNKALSTILTKLLCRSVADGEHMHAVAFQGIVDGSCLLVLVLYLNENNGVENSLRKRPFGAPEHFRTRAVTLRCRIT
jgi:hypothetical protein